jgi:CBS domain-containing protein
VGLTESIPSVAGKMNQHDVGAVVVTQDRQVVGIVTDRDIALAVGREDFSVDDPVDKVMTKDVKTIWEDQGVFNATQYLRDQRVRCKRAARLSRKCFWKRNGTT